MFRGYLIILVILTYPLLGDEITDEYAVIFLEDRKLRNVIQYAKM